MAKTTRQPGIWNPNDILILGAIGGIFALALAIYPAMKLGHKLSGSKVVVPDNLFEVFFGLLFGKIPWPGFWGWIVLLTLLVLIVLIVVLVVFLISRLKSKTTRVDKASAYMGTGRDISGLSYKRTLEIAKRLGVTDGNPGVPLGKSQSSGKTLYGSWEDMQIDIWGPRTGKTTSRAIPAILNAPGAVIATSNKRDFVDATRDLRAKVGSVWVFDPQSLALEEPTWWWNPLSYVTDEVKAARLAQHFAAGSRDPGARTDAFFDPAGQDLLAALLLAAALDNQPITQVYTWLTRPSDETAVDILRAYNFSLTADQLEGVISAPDKQRGGIYGTAMQMASCLTNRQVARWVTPQDTSDYRPQFHPEEFIRSKATLYSLSKEGKGSAGPLVTALTVAVVEAAEELASRSKGGRLQTPLLGVLDEAANVCRWKDLPDLYSHYGSRGIVIITILQSWSQGVEVWGELGMKKLWSAANIKIYGGGVSEPQFLDAMSQIIGDREKLTYSSSTGQQHRSVSRQIQRERILDVADLAALPRGRALVFASGMPPTMIRTIPWMASEQAQEIKASIAAHDPQAH